jgi:hypothetical protein
MAALDALTMAASRLSATLSRSSSNRSAYTSNVMDALACPNIRCNALTLAPADTARDAAVCRRSCGVIVGNDSSAFWHACTAGSNTHARRLELRGTPPRRSVNTQPPQGEALLPGKVGARRFVIRATHERGVGVPSSRSFGNSNS